MNPRWASPALFVLSFGVFGVLDGLTLGERAAESVLTVIHVALMAFLLFWWASADAALRGARLSTAMTLCIVVFGVFSVPFYLARSRPAAAWARWLPKGLVVLALCVGSYVGLLSLFSGTDVPG
jgi:hypothetical protein